MADAEMLTVFVCDEAEARTRRRVSACLEDVAVRVQKSVFEAMLTAARTRCQTFGGGPMLENEPYYLL